MIKNQQIICISSTTWYGYYTKSTVQILERLAASNQVLFIEYPHTWKDCITTLLKKQNGPQVARMLGLSKRLKTITTASSTRVYNLVIPPTLPVYFLKNEKLFNWLFRINSSIYRRSVRKAARTLGFDQPIVIGAFNPFYGNALLGKLNEKAHIYYCYDAVESWFYGERIFTTEQQYLKKVDGVITTSNQLYKEKSSVNSNCITVKNGVDFQLFSPHARTGISHRERKKIGYIGSLDHRFDIDLVEFVIRHSPDFDFEFTGALLNESVKTRLSGYPNVRFFEPVDSSMVPALLASYDAGMIPYLCNDANKNIYPLKINEYLAVGVPLVMTDFARLPEFDSMVSTASNEEQFLMLLHREINSDSLAKVKDRINFAKNNSWEARTEEFGNALIRFTIGKMPGNND
jgi:glycosyltransferase involved in cell wall biosynthesis